uniref:Uncharacterized protein n=1 Tax=Daphnia galeata TaxID=27404 RepID=A0A8J2WLM7_9CRUS|nr:unnamed protein product [Daphnia galeata]
MISAASRPNNRLFLLPPSLFSSVSPRPTVSTVTISSSITITKIETTSIVCAKLVNVTGPCLKQRGAWVEEPIVLSFHEDFDDTFDLKYSPVLKVETSATPESTKFHESRLNNDPSTVVASSVNDEDQYERQNELPFFFISSFNRWFGSLLSQFVITTVPTNTIIFQQTITVTQTATVFNTVFVQRCTPSPFPFSLCRKKKSIPSFR